MTNEWPESCETCLEAPAAVEFRGSDESTGYSETLYVCEPCALKLSRNDPAKEAAAQSFNAPEAEVEALLESWDKA